MAIPKKTKICNHLKTTPEFLWLKVYVFICDASKAIPEKIIKDTSMNIPPRI
jgi:hypothetical protein